MTKVRWYFITIALVGFNLFLIFKIHQKNQLITACTNHWIKSDQKVDNYLNYFIEREKRRNESENIHLSDQLMMVGLDDRMYFLNEKLGSSPVLIFRFSSSNCQTCINIEIKRIKEYLKGTDTSKVIILSSGEDLHMLEYFKKVNQVNYEIYKLEKDNLNIPIERYNLPYLFILTPDGFTSSVFIPEKDENKFSQQYYDAIKKIL